MVVKTMTTTYDCKFIVRSKGTKSGQTMKSGMFWHSGQPRIFPGYYYTSNVANITKVQSKSTRLFVGMWRP